jgi:hypothetical protein
MIVDETHYPAIKQVPLGKITNGDVSHQVMGIFRVDDTNNEVLLCSYLCDRMVLSVSFDDKETVNPMEDNLFVENDTKETEEEYVHKAKTTLYTSVLNPIID